MDTHKKIITVSCLRQVIVLHHALCLFIMHKIFENFIIGLASSKKRIFSGEHCKMQNNGKEEKVFRSFCYLNKYHQGQSLFARPVPA